MKNVVIGIVSSTLAVSSCTFILGVAEEYPNWQISAIVAGVAAVVSFIALLVIALPLHYIFVRSGKLNIGWYVFPSIFVGPAFVFGLKPFGEDSASELIVQSLTCSFLGTIGAAVFWLIVVRRPRLVSNLNRDKNHYA